MTSIGSRISHRITHSSRQLRLSVNRSGARLAISHPDTLQDIKGILTLVKEKTYPQKKKEGEDQPDGAQLSRPRSGEADPDPSWQTLEGRR
jgi:hypothetical protein